MIKVQVIRGIEGYSDISTEVENFMNNKNLIKDQIISINYVVLDNKVTAYIHYEKWLCYNIDSKYTGITNFWQSIYIEVIIDDQL